MIDDLFEPPSQEELKERKRKRYNCKHDGEKGYKWIANHRIIEKRTDGSYLWDAYEVGECEKCGGTKKRLV